MRTTALRATALALVSALALFPAICLAAAPIRVMILDGESAGPYHNWKLVTSVLRKQLEETGLFRIDVVSAPPAGGDLRSFAPDFPKYQVVVLN